MIQQLIYRIFLKLFFNLNTEDTEDILFYLNSVKYWFNWAKK